MTARLRKSTDIPLTRTKHPEPDRSDSEWLIWAAWADRVTFEEIQERTGFSEADLIKEMRRQMTPATFRRWRRRVRKVGLKHRTLFRAKRAANQWSSANAEDPI